MFFKSMTSIKLLCLSDRGGTEFLARKERFESTALSLAVTPNKYPEMDFCLRSRGRKVMKYYRKRGTFGSVRPE